MLKGKKTIMAEEALALALAEAGRGGDDMPPVLFVGSGSGNKRCFRADLALDAFLEDARRGGRVVAFDSAAARPGALDEAAAMAAFDTGCLLDRRQVCALRLIDEMHPDDVPRLKRLIESRGKWWVMSASGTGKLRTLLGFFVLARVSKARAQALCRRYAAPPSPPPVPRIARISDAAAAVASGASVPEIVEAFRRYAAGRTDVRTAVVAAAQLDVDLRTNKRPLMMSTLVEDAVRDVQERAERGPP